ncbi:MAG TPA: biotin--[acetyl-CoA-carboxylase] ligase [Paucimonas sp.]|nr:biotin--[acetyl-CoA-carboxylase] ligase [Paucimonas sp.]
MRLRAGKDVCLENDALRYNAGMTSSASFSLSAASIAALRAPVAEQVDIRVVESTGSTNADLAGQLANLRAPTLLVAHRQTAGRGRAGRSWLSAPGRSLTFSLAWKFAMPVHALVGLPLAAGIALAEALAGLDVRVGLKWPNDVLYEGDKLAGILIETAAAGREASWAVIGIGVNLALDAETMARIGQPAANLPQLAAADPNRLLAAFLNRLAEAMLQFEQRGLHAFVDRWNALHAHAGRPVAIVDRGAVVHEGVAAGIDWIGRLLVDTEQGRVAVMAGDVSLRAKGER